jgi:hypothetical protein
MARIAARRLGFSWSPSTYQGGTHRPADQQMEGEALAARRARAGTVAFRPGFAPLMVLSHRLGADEGIPPGGMPAPPVPTGLPKYSQAELDAAVSKQGRMAAAYGAAAGAGAVALVVIAVHLMRRRRK